MAALDHTGLCPADMDMSLRFYRDGIGLAVLVDVVLDVDVQPLLGVTTTKLRTVFLGDTDHRGAGVVELVDLGIGTPAEGAPGGGLPHRGAFLLSFQVPVEETLTRLKSLGLGGEPRRMDARGSLTAVVVDPDGVMIELLGRPVSL